MLEEIKRQLGINYRNDDLTIIDLLKSYTSVALNISNRVTEKGLEPYIIKAVLEHYMRMGNEGLSSSNEAGISYSYIDIEEKLRKDIIKNGMRVIK